EYRTYYNAYADHPKLKSAKEKRVLIAFKGRDASILIPHMTRHGLKFIIYELGHDFSVMHLNTEVMRHHAMSLLLHAGHNAEQIMAHLGLRRLGNIAKHLSAQKSEL